MAEVADKNSEAIIADVIRTLSEKDGFPRTFVDVGANKNASVSAPFIELGWRCLLIEPQRHCISGLKDTYGSNPLVSIERCACSDENGTLTLFHGKDGDGSELSTLNASADPWMNMVRNLDDYEEVKVCRLADIISKYSDMSEVGILKIDTESWDFKVLAGLDFSTCKPKLIVTEEYLWDANAQIGKHKLLEDRGYVNIGWVEYNTIWCLRDYYSISWSELAMKKWLGALKRLPRPIDRVEGLHPMDVLLARTRAYDNLMDDLNLVGGARPYTCKAGQNIKVPVVVANMGGRTVPCNPDLASGRQLLVSYHWLDMKGDVVIWDGLRTHLHEDIEPRGAAVVDLVVEAPQMPGTYQLDIDCVVEHVGWLSSRGSSVARCQVTVGAA